MNTEELSLRHLLPTNPPHEMIKWMAKKLKNHGLVYRSGPKLDKVTAICSACGKHIEFEKLTAEGCGMNYAPAPFGFKNEYTKKSVIHGNMTKCPNCQKEVCALHVSRVSPTWQLDRGHPVQVTKVAGNLTIICWFVEKLIDKDGGITIEAKGYEAYILTGKSLKKFKGYYKYYFGTVITGAWDESRSAEDTLGTCNLVYPWDKKLLKGTQAENSKLDIFMRRADCPIPVSYLRLYLKHRNVENLVMQGAAKYVNRCIKSTSNSYEYKYTSIVKGINWSEVKPHRMLGLTKEQFKGLAKYGWSRDVVQFIKDMRERGEMLSAEDIQRCIGVGINSCGDPGHKEPIMRIVCYAEKQQKNCRGGCEPVIYHQDYWQMFKKLHSREPRTPLEKYPKNIKTAHDNIEKQIKYKEKEHLRAAFEKRYKELSKFAFEHGDFLIRPVKNERELIDEGRDLGHCVGSYAESHAKGLRSLFFIRRVDDPQTSYYTLEFNVNSGTVVQNRGKRNCERTPEIQEFENLFVEHAKKSLKERGKKNVKPKSDDYAA